MVKVTQNFLQCILRSLPVTKVLWSLPVTVACLFIGVGTGGMCPPKFSMCAMPTLYVLYYKFNLLHTVPPQSKSLSYTSAVVYVTH